MSVPVWERIRLAAVEELDSCDRVIVPLWFSLTISTGAVDTRPVIVMFPELVTRTMS